MERTEDRSAASMPLILIMVAGLFLGARIADLAMNCLQYSRASLPGGASTIAWLNLPEPDSLAGPLPPYSPPRSQDLSPETERRLAEILMSSRAAGKYVIYEFAADWSDPCKTMEGTALSNAQIKTLVQDNFMPVRISDRFKETGGHNPRIVSDLQKKFHVFAFPTLVVVDENGKLAGSLVGNCSSLTVYRFLSRTLAALRHSA